MLSTVEGYLRDGPGPLRDLETPEPKLAKNETLLDAIERNRRRVRELAADLHRVHSAPYPSAHVKQRLRQQVEELAVRGAPSVSRLIEHDGPVEFATTQLRAKVHNSEPAAVAITEMPDTVAMFAWLHRDLLIKRLDGLIADESDDAAALTPEARAKATTEIQGDLLAVERDESALVWQAQAQGLPVEHRSDIDPRALLGVVLVAPSGSRGTSPERVLTIAGAR